MTKPPGHDKPPENLKAALTEFIEILGQDNVMTDHEIMKSYAGSDWSSYVQKENEVHAIVLTPGSTEDVSRIMKVCHKRVMPVTAYAGGTSLEGHFAATKGGVSIDFQRMNQIVALHKDDLDVVVQPGVEWEALNEELAQTGLFFPPDPAARMGAFLGGSSRGWHGHGNEAATSQIQRRI
ncbi:FAD-binding oxidoreductase [Aspergillus chevalieri]|uniref:D-lactate ferricytochrome c oxidoreductase n=1 Tax=Aspergillus chevalieri TaxID=182096 RepID=A0A7R7ZQ52_ASPCH|nr:D-lactate ferricytochrome c oxidoreductase [Aspergillus chevalieri]BCR90650.1 D-lactate ferricytochrome c oxidoreductase [Aspergillus chevalieri]